MCSSLSALSPNMPSAAQEFRRGLSTSLPVTIGVIPFALVLGAAAAQKGFFLLEVPLLTGLNFAGGSEFAAIQIWTTPPRLWLIVALTFLINSRHLLMGATLAPLLAHRPKRQVLPALFLMCDESWAMGYEDAQKRIGLGLERAFSMPYYMGVAMNLYVMWVICTTLGAAVGPLIGDMRAYGVDLAFPAVFLVLLRGLWKGARAARPWLVSLVAAAVVHLLAPGSWHVMAGAAAGLAAAWFLEPSHD